MSLLDYSLPPNDLIDFVRYVVGLLGVFLFCVAIVQWLRKLAFWSPLGFCSVGLVTAFQSIEGLEQEFYPWRLPLLLVAVVAGLVHLYSLPDRQERT